MKKHFAWINGLDFGMARALQIVEVEKETNKAVWVDGRKKFKETDGSVFCDTWEEARNFLLAYLDREIAAKEHRLAVLKKNRDAALALKEEK